MTSEIKYLVDHMEPREIWENLDGILSSGISIDYLLTLGEPYEGFFFTHSDQLLNLGADPQTLFGVTERDLISVDSTMQMKYLLDRYVEHGLSQQFAENWAKEHVY